MHALNIDNYVNWFHLHNTPINAILMQKSHNINLCTVIILVGLFCLYIRDKPAGLITKKKLGFPDVFHETETQYNTPCADPFLMYTSLPKIRQS